MEKKAWSPRIMTRYALIQLPGLVLLVFILLFAGRWVQLPPWIFWGSIAAWIVKDVILYPFLWRAYEWSSRQDSSRMAGERGVARERLDPSGYVQVRGELWRAEVMEGSPSIEEGVGVSVREVHGLTLIVEPVEEGEKTA